MNRPSNNICSSPSPSSEKAAAGRATCSPWPFVWQQPLQRAVHPRTRRRWQARARVIAHANRAILALNALRGCRAESLVPAPPPPEGHVGPRVGLAQRFAIRHILLVSWQASCDGALSSVFDDRPAGVWASLDFSLAHDTPGAYFSTPVGRKERPGSRGHEDQTQSFPSLTPSIHLKLDAELVALPGAGVAGALRRYVIWVPSRFAPSDGPSRGASRRRRS